MNFLKYITIFTILILSFNNAQGQEDCLSRFKEIGLPIHWGKIEDQK